MVFCRSCTVLWELYGVFVEAVRFIVGTVCFYVEPVRFYVETVWFYVERQRFEINQITTIRKCH